jgi:CheY-like chemotaxis protein
VVARILVVDDDPVIRDLLSDVLEAEGYDVFQAANGQVAVEIARRSRPHLILMDLMMPVLDGSSAIRILKSADETRRIRIIVMSAVMNLRRFSEELPADGLLDKPFDLDTLLSDVAQQVNVRDEIGMEEVS